MPRHRSSSSPVSGEARTSRTGVPPAHEVGVPTGSRRHRSRPDAPEATRSSGGRSGFFFGFLVLLIFALPLVWVLAGRGIDYRTQLLEHWSWDDSSFLGYAPRSRSLPMQTESVGADGHPHFLEFGESEGLPREGLRSIDLQFDVRRMAEAGADKPVVTRLLRGEIRDLDGGSIWTARPGQKLRTEGLVEFLSLTGREGRQSVDQIGTQVLRRWRVTVWTDDPVQVGIRCHLSAIAGGAPPPRGPGKWAAPVRGVNDQIHWAYPHGRVTTWSPGEGVSRAAVVAATWGRTGALWTWLWMGVSVLLITSGVVWMARRGTEPMPSLRPAWAGLALALVFGGTGLIQLILHPAYQGVDEHVHVLGAHLQMNDRRSVTNGWDFGKQVHAARLFGRTHQKLTVADTQEPFRFFYSDSPLNWGLRPFARSATAARLVQVTHGWMAEASAPDQVFRMRLVNLVLVSLAVGLAGAVLARSGRFQAGAGWMGWCLVLIPSLGYFAMNMSNYPILLAGYLVIGAVLAAAVNQDTIGWRVLLLLGVVIGLVVQTSINGILMTVVPGFGLLGLALFRPRRSAEDGSEESEEGSVGWAGWGALAAGLLLARGIGFKEYDAEIGLTVGRKITELLQVPVPPYWMLVLIACGGLAIVERVASAGFPLNPGDGRGRGMRWVGGLAVAVIALLGFNAVWPAPQLGMLMEAVPGWEFIPNQAQLLPRADLPAPPDPAPSVSAYTGNVLKSFIASWGPGDADFMLSRLFWQSDGYLDTLMPEWIRWFLTSLLGAGLAIQLWRISQRRNRVRFGRLLFVGLGLLAALVILAVGARSATASPSLHGRYLIGIYCMLIPVAFLGWKGLIVRWELRHAHRIGLLLVVPMLVLQLTGILTTIFRYFG